MQYPYYSPQVLTDAVFLQYGGQTGTSSVAQRQAAYLLAEEQMSEHLSAFLVPTIVTGTAFRRGGTLFETEYGYVTQVLNVSAVVIKQVYPLDTEIKTGTALIRNSDYGYLDVLIDCTYDQIYSNTVVYQSGLATGTVTSPNMLAALSLAAQIHLNEWDISLANEGAYDVGVQAFSNQGYSETRKPLLRTVFGNSAAAQRVAQMTRKYRAKPSIGFR